MGCQIAGRRPLRALVALLALITASCAGIPTKSPVTEVGAFGNEKKLSELVTNYDEKSRNAWIELNVMRINEDYRNYTESLQQWRTNSGMATSAIALLSNVASSLTPSAGVKANYVALNAIATGFNEIAFKEQFMEQTVSTLIAAMDGNRAEAYARVRIGMSKPVGEYTLADAHFDMLDFAWASRIEQGMDFVVKAAGEASADAKSKAAEDIAKIVSYTEDERQLSFCTSESLDHLTSANLDALKKVMLDLKLDVPANPDIDKLVHAVTLTRLNSTPKFQREFNAAMKANNLLINPCPRY